MQATEVAQATRQMIPSDDMTDLEECDLILQSGHMTGERPARLVVPAAERPLPDTWGLTSVFDLAYLPLPVLRCGRGGRIALAPAKLPLQDQVHIVVTREPGVTRCQRQHYSETQAWLDQERARRARQRPPKPTAKAKTKSSKLIDLVGV